jgi:hypothetical protein
MQHGSDTWWHSLSRRGLGWWAALTLILASVSAVVGDIANIGENIAGLFSGAGSDVVIRDIRQELAIPIYLPTDPERDPRREEQEALILPHGVQTKFMNIYARPGGIYGYMAIFQAVFDNNGEGLARECLAELLTDKDSATTGYLTVGGEPTVTLTYPHIFDENLFVGEPISFTPHSERIVSLVFFFFSGEEMPADGSDIRVVCDGVVTSPLPLPLRWP